MRKTFLCTSIFLYMTNFSCTCIRTLLFMSHGLYTNPIYVQRFFFVFPSTHQRFKSLFFSWFSLPGNPSICKGWEVCSINTGDTSKFLKTSLHTHDSLFKLISKLFSFTLPCFVLCFLPFVLVFHC